LADESRDALEARQALLLGRLERYYRIVRSNVSLDRFETLEELLVSRQALIDELIEISASIPILPDVARRIETQERELRRFMKREIEMARAEMGDTRRQSKAAARYARER
jgi:hypothetical protein